ncbi:MAG: tol-pal system protein YbgF [Myxococcales bacterium]|nr:tol-pal system protein YbgF [Myxococcales bacterium]
MTQAIAPLALASWAALARRKALGGAGAVLASALLAGCAGTAQERQMASMQEHLDKLQLEQDRTAERIDAVEGAVDKRGAARPPRRAEPPPVVQLSVPEEHDLDPSEDAEDTSPRPSIRVAGTPQPRAAAVRSKGKNDRVDATGIDDEPRPPGSRPSALDPEAKRAYEAALSLVQGRRYGEGVEALNAFLTKWPDHPYAENAVYWRGECFFAQGDYARAIGEFESVVARPQSGAKVPDAMLKLGIAHDKMGHADKARAAYDRLAREYPKSDAARRIPGSSAASGPKGPKN